MVENSLLKTAVKKQLLRCVPVPFRKACKLKKIFDILPVCRKRRIIYLHFIRQRFLPRIRHKRQLSRKMIPRLPIFSMENKGNPRLPANKLLLLKHKKQIVRVGNPLHPAPGTVSKQDCPPVRAALLRPDYKLFRLNTQFRHLIFKFFLR